MPQKNEENQSLEGNQIVRRAKKSPAPIRDDRVPRKSNTKELPTTSKPVVTRIKKQSFVTKLKDSLLGDDADSVAHYILWDVLIPAAKDTIQSMVTQGIEMMLFGSSGGRDRGRRLNTRSGGTMVRYGNYYNNPGRGRESRTSRQDEYVRSSGRANRLENVLFDYEEEASEVLEIMISVLEEYGQVSVADFYEVAGLSTYSDYTDNAIGWHDLGRTRIIRTREGFQLIFPQPVRLD